MSEDEQAKSMSETAARATAEEAERCDPRVLELLVCPITKASLDYDPVRQELISRTARLAYPIRRGVPHMVPSEARHLDDPERPR